MVVVSLSHYVIVTIERFKNRIYYCLKMTVDLMLVDDYDIMLNQIELLAQLGRKLKIITFNSGTEALKYLRDHIGDLPRGYVVDMRLSPSNVEPEAIKAELEAPVEIYRFLAQHGRTKYFRFYTGHISEHDRQVQRETGVEILVKCKDEEKLEDMFEELARTKPTTSSQRIRSASSRVNEYR